MIWQGVIFQGFGVNGWSNVYYMNQASNADALAALQALNTKQLAIQADYVRTIALRISDVTVKGDGTLVNANTTNGALVSGGANPDGPINIAARFLFQDAAFKVRVNHYIHGLRIGDFTVNADGTLSPSVAYTTLAAVNAYILEVEQDTVSWPKRVQPPVTQALTSGSLRGRLSDKKVGRPFGLVPGRRRIA